MQLEKSELPSGYARVDYLESTGTQGLILDTIVPDDNIATKIVFSLTNLNFDWSSNNHFVIAKYENNNKRYRPIKITSGKQFQVQNSNASVLYSKSIDLNKHTIIFNGENHKGYFDNTLFGSAIATSLAGHAGGGIGISAQSSISSTLETNSFTPMRLYELSFYDNSTNEILGEFIPCLDKDNIPCLYDKVSKQTFYNRGTGEFLYG